MPDNVFDAFNRPSGLKCKIFAGWSVEEMEKQVNEFFKENPFIKIVDVELSSSLETTTVEHYHKVVISIIYEET